MRSSSGGCASRRSPAGAEVAPVIRLAATLRPPTAAPHNSECDREADDPLRERNKRVGLSRGRLSRLDQPDSMRSGLLVEFMDSFGRPALYLGARSRADRLVAMAAQSDERSDRNLLPARVVSIRFLNDGCLGLPTDAGDRPSRTFRPDAEGR